MCRAIAEYETQRLVHGHIQVIRIPELIKRYGLKDLLGVYEYDGKKVMAANRMLRNVFADIVASGRIRVQKQDHNVTYVR